MIANADIRAKLAITGVKQFEVADRLNINETSLSRKLRRELQDSEKQRIFAIIDEIAAQKENAARNTANIPNG